MLRSVPWPAHMEEGRLRSPGLALYFFTDVGHQCGDLGVTVTEVDATVHHREDRSGEVAVALPGVFAGDFVRAALPR